MATISKTLKKIRRPVIVSVPVMHHRDSLSLKDAEAIVRHAGGRPMTKKERERFNAFK